MLVDLILTWTEILMVWTRVSSKVLVGTGSWGNPLPLPYLQIF